MLDGVSHDQIRTFLAAAEEGSFSAAGRKLGRAQSVVSQTLANLEGQLGLLLFSRNGHKPVLTEQGRALVEPARAVLASMDVFRSRAKTMALGREAELRIVIDAMFPVAKFAQAVHDFRDAFPDVRLYISVEALGAVIQPVLEKKCSFSIIGSLPVCPAGITAELLAREEMLIVAAPEHPLSNFRGVIPAEIMAHHTQLILTDRSPLTAGQEFGIMSEKQWHFADLHAKISFLKRGLGWGCVPREMIKADLESGRLNCLHVAEATEPFFLSMRAVYRSDSPPGPAGRWLINKLHEV